MEKGGKIASVITVIPIFILFLIEIIRVYFCTEQIKLYVIILFFLLVSMPVLLGYAAFLSKIRKPTWWAAFSKAFSDLMLIYFGFVIILISLNTDILPKMGRWDISMFSLGVALIFFGITYLTYQKQEPLLENLTGKIDKIEKMVSKLQPPKTRGRKPKK